MAPFFSGISGGLSGQGGFGFGRKKITVVPRIRKLTVPAAVYAPTKWDLDVNGALTLSGPSSYTITAGNPDGSWSGTVTVAMWAAGGTAAYLGDGGGGGGSFGDITLINGTSYIMVSGHAAPGYGGGYSGIFMTSETQPNAIMMAGGGGGGGSYSENYIGGEGGGTTGGQGAGPAPGNSTGGGGGTQSAGGAGGTSGGNAISYGAGAGSALLGGRGANGGAPGPAGAPATPSGGPGGGGQYGTNTNSWQTGGGGGGYFGGGGGGAYRLNDSVPVIDTPAAGGGGSGYINPVYVTNGNTYPHSNPISKNHPQRGTAGNGGIDGVGGPVAAVAGKIILS